MRSSSSSRMRSNCASTDVAPRAVSAGVSLTSGGGDGGIVAVCGAVVVVAVVVVGGGAGTLARWLPMVCLRCTTAPVLIDEASAAAETVPLGDVRGTIGARRITAATCSARRSSGLRSSSSKNRGTGEGWATWVSSWAITSAVGRGVVTWMTSPVVAAALPTFASARREPSPLASLHRSVTEDRRRQRLVVARQRPRPLRPVPLQLGHEHLRRRRRCGRRGRRRPPNLGAIRSKWASGRDSSRIPRRIAPSSRHPCQRARHDHWCRHAPPSATGVLRGIPCRLVPAERAEVDRELHPGVATTIWARSVAGSRTIRAEIRVALTVGLGVECVGESGDDDVVWSHGWPLPHARCRVVRHRAHHWAGEAGAGRRTDARLGVEFAVGGGVERVGEAGDDDAVWSHGRLVPRAASRLIGHGVTDYWAGDAGVGRRVDSPVGEFACDGAVGPLRCRVDALVGLGVRGRWRGGGGR